MGKYGKYIKRAGKAAMALYAGSKGGGGGGGSGGKSKASKYRKSVSTKKQHKSKGTTTSATRKKTQTIYGVGAHISNSSTSIPARKPPSSFCRKMPLVDVQSVDSGTATSIFGSQKVGDAVAIFNSANWAQLKSQATVTGAASVVSGPSGNTDDFRYFLKSANIELTFSNQGQDMIELIIYDIVSRANQQGSEIQPAASFATAITQNQGAQTNASTFPYNTPEKYKRFTKSFRIVKSTTCWLPGGGVHRHWFRHGLNKVVSASYLDNYVTYAGLTGYVMIIVKGVPRDQSLTSVASGITLANTKLVWVSRTMINGALYTVIPSSDNLNTTLTSTATHLYAPEVSEEVGDLNTAMTAVVAQAVVGAGFG